MNGMGRPATTDELIHRLRLMADSGGVLTRDRIRTVMDAADRLEEMDEKIAFMTEGWKPEKNTGGDSD